MIEPLISLILTTALLLGSPGPAPLSLAFVSSNYGLKKGLNYLYGVLLGLFVVTCATGLGLYEFLKFYPKLISFFGAFAFLYMLYIAYKISFGAGTSTQKNTSAPTWINGFVLNISNPKAYAAFFAIFSALTLPFENQVYAILFTGLVSFSTGVVVDLAWVLLGVSLSKYLQDPAVNNISKKVCGALLIFVLVFAFVKTLKI